MIHQFYPSPIQKLYTRPYKLHSRHVPVVIDWTQLNIMAKVHNLALPTRPYTINRLNGRSMTAFSIYMKIAVAPLLISLRWAPIAVISFLTWTYSRNHLNNAIHGRSSINCYFNYEQLLACILQMIAEVGPWWVHVTKCNYSVGNHDYVNTIVCKEARD